MEFAIWSIKVFKSNFIFTEKPNESEFNKPTLTAKDVSDVPADFIADPFIISDNSKFYMFFEVLNKLTERGEIGLATSEDGDDWNYEKIVLNEPYHLSYPHVFKKDDQFYMIPESMDANGVFLYKAKIFPNKWEKVCEIIHGNYIDPSIFHYKDKWWLFVGSNKGNLHLSYSDKIDQSWVEHSKSPLISDDYAITRPAARVIVNEGDIYRFTQDNFPYYGKLVRSFKINKLSETEYLEEEVNVILEGSNKEDWRKDGMHQIDQLKINDNEWLIAVDGHEFHYENYIIWKVKRFIRNPIACARRGLNRKKLLIVKSIKKVILWPHRLS